MAFGSVLTVDGRDLFLRLNLLKMKKGKKTKFVKSPSKFLIDTGLLFEINRTLLHRYGIALSVILDEDRAIETSDKFQIIDSTRDDPEGICFDSETFEHGSMKYKKFSESDDSKDRICERIDRLKFDIQEK